MRLIGRIAKKIIGLNYRRFQFLVQVSFLFLLVPGNMQNTQVLEYPLLPGPILNPLMGLAPWATISESEQPHTLVYVDMTWREIEPEEGFYNFSAFEEDQQLARWRAEGKRVVFRFVLDKPGDQAHLDIPDWLYQQIDQDGDQYSGSYGRGFSPNYSNPILIEKHQRVLEVLGYRYGQDDFFAFVELGSLGHWGEWHVDQSAGIRRLPPEETLDVYVQHYLDSFPNAMLLMRRPFGVAAREKLGIYNDMTGDPDATTTWLSWIEDGGEYDQADGLSFLEPMPNGWIYGPIGGEQTHMLQNSSVYGSNLETTIDLVRRSHTTFIGPGGPYDEAYGGALQSGIDAVLENLGFRLFIARAEMPFAIAEPVPGAVRVDLLLGNAGVAPMYFNWPVKMFLFDEAGTVIKEQAVRTDLRRILPDQFIPINSSIPVENLNPGVYSIGIAIIDPITDQPAIQFANPNRRTDRIFEIGSFHVLDENSPPIPVQSIE